MLLKSSKICGLSLLLLVMTGTAFASPSVFWASDPIRPGETVLVVGDGLGDHPATEVARLTDGPAGSPPGALPTSVTCGPAAAAIQPGSQSLKFVLPSGLKPGLFVFEIATPTGKVRHLLNRPELWWAQGDGGTTASPGGWLRLFGKNLTHTAGQPATVVMHGPQALRLTASGDEYALRVSLPNNLAQGDYRIYVHNGWGGPAGWSPGLVITVRHLAPWPSRVYNVKDFGADGSDQKDDTATVKAALAEAKADGGGVVYFPRGRYQVSETLQIPRFTVLRGEDRELSALFWPDLQEPPSAWMAGTSCFGLENLTLYCSNYKTFLTGDSSGEDAGNVFLRRLRIRANVYRGHMKAEEMERRYRAGLGSFGGGYWLVSLGGRKVEITDCDLYSSGNVISLRQPRGCRIERNVLSSGRWGGSGVFGGDGLILADNHYIGGSLTSWGAAGGLGYGNLAHVYIARNSFALEHGGDRESITSDASGGLYCGPIVGSEDSSVTLPQPPGGASQRWIGAAVFVVSGRGVGQWRRIVGFEGARVLVDRPWRVPPDSSSLVAMTWLLNQWLVVDNHFSDVGSAVQFYGSSLEHIVARNTCERAGGYQAIGKAYGGYQLPPDKNPCHQPSWFCQFLDNRITEGNIYRSGPDNSIYSGTSVIGIFGYRLTTGDCCWKWPYARGAIVRRNHLLNNARIHIGGSQNQLPTVRDVVVENNHIANTDVGIELDRATAGIVLRGNTFDNVDQPLSGPGVEKAWISPAEQAGAWLEAIETALAQEESNYPAARQVIDAAVERLRRPPTNAPGSDGDQLVLVKTIWNRIAESSPGECSPKLLHALVGLSLSPAAESASLTEVLATGQGGPGEIAVTAKLLPAAPALSLALKPTWPAGWQAEGALPVVELEPGQQKSLKAAVSVPAGAWGAYAIPVKVAVSLGDKALPTQLRCPVGRGEIYQWAVVGPFANREAAALDRTVHPPEYRLDLKAEYVGVGGNIRWQPLSCPRPGLDLNSRLGAGENRTAYVVAVVRAARETPVVVGVSCQAGTQVWLNDEERPGLRLEQAGQRQILTSLPPGDNIFLFKVSQQKGPWSLSAYVNETGPGAGGNLELVPAAELSSIAALTPPALPMVTAGSELPYAEGVAWDLVYSDDFEAAALISPKWKATSGQWQVAHGLLSGQGPAAFLAYSQKVPAPLRIEYDARSSNPGDLSAFYLDDPPDYQRGYLWGFASGNNTQNKLVCNGQSLAVSHAPLATPGKWYHVIAQILPGQIFQLLVDGKLSLSYREMESLGAPRYLGLWTWAQGQFDNVKIYTGRVAEP